MSIFSVYVEPDVGIVSLVHLSSTALFSRNEGRKVIFGVSIDILLRTKTAKKDDDRVKGLLSLFLCGTRGTPARRHEVDLCSQREEPITGRGRKQT